LQKDSAAVFENEVPELVIISLDSENLDIIESVVQKNKYRYQSKGEW